MGDYITSLDNQPIHLYDQIMAKLPQLPRPLTIGFRKKMEGIGGNETTTTGQALSKKQVG